VDGHRDPVYIAEQFQKVFTSIDFHSYADKKSVFELKERLSKMDKRELTKNFLSRVSTLTRDIDITILSVCLSVRLSATSRLNIS